MARKESSGDIVETLKQRGVTCAKLKSMEKREIREASEFRRAGFNNLAASQENSAKKLRGLRQQVCKLR